VVKAQEAFVPIGLPTLYDRKSDRSGVQKGEPQRI